LHFEIINPFYGIYGTDLRPGPFSNYIRAHIKRRLQHNQRPTTHNLDYLIPVTQLNQGPKGNGDMQAEKRD